MIGLIDILLLAIVVGVAWCVAGEGAWGAGSTLICVILSGLLAMNFFEPLARFLQGNVAPSWNHYWDFISLIGLFACFVTLLRLVAERLMPAYIYVQPHLHLVCTWGGSLLAGYVTMAFLLTALHTAPLPREFFGFTPERENFFGILAPDRQWLGFTQYVTEHPFAQQMEVIDRRGNLLHLTTRTFDGRTGWFWGLPGDENQSQVMPSFTIRYATRRERLAAGSVVTRGSSTVRRVKRSKNRSRRSSPDF